MTDFLRPPLNKKSFPVYRPGGSKRADWKCVFFHIFNFFYTFLPVHSSFKKIEIREKKSQPPDWQFFSPPGPQETIFYLRVALPKLFNLNNFGKKIRHGSVSSVSLNQ